MEKNNNVRIVSDNAKYLFHSDQVIIINRTNRQWMKVSKECYDILTQCNGSNGKDSNGRNIIRNTIAFAYSRCF